MNRRPNSWRGSGWLALVELAVALGATAVVPAAAANYSFVNIADSSGTFSSFGGASINKGGMVAFAGVRAGVAGIYAGHGGAIITVADTTGPFSEVGYAASINDAGLVAFRATLDTGGMGVFTGSGGPTTPIVDSSGPFASFEPPAINNSNMLVFSATLDGGNAGIYVSNGGTPTTIASLGGSGMQDFLGFDLPVINNSGTVAFLAYSTFGGGGAGGSGIFSGHGGPVTTITYAGLPTASFSDPSINDGGAVAYVRYNSAGPYILYVNSGGTNTPVATTDGGVFGNFQSPSINSSGTVAFLGYLYSYSSTNDYGIFTGSDPVADKVIQPGDALFGSTITSLSAPQFNDDGDIVFGYVLVNGVKGIAVARTGDYNGNGTVDAADYVVWRKGLGTIYTQADFDVWRSHFGQTAGSGAGFASTSASAVPEPTSIVLLALVSATLTLATRRMKI